jgi:hypothetical protein
VELALLTVRVDDDDLAVAREADETIRRRLTSP